MGLSLQRLAQLCAMSESTETRVISNVNCRLLNYFKPSYDSKSSMILKEMGRVFTNWFCPPPAYEEELSDTRAEDALSSPDAGGRSRLLVSNRRLLQHSGTSRSGHCWAPEEFGTGHAPPAGSSQRPAALSSSELPCSRRSRAPGPELQDGIAQSNETRSVPCHRKGDGVAAVTEEDRRYLKNQQLQRNADSWSSSTSHCVLFLLCHLLWLPSSMPTCDRRVVFFSTLLSFLDNWSPLCHCWTSVTRVLRRHELEEMGINADLPARYTSPTDALAQLLTQKSLLILIKKPNQSEV